MYGLKKGSFNVIQRKKCPTCIYRGDMIRHNCDDILVTLKMRNCDAEDCDKYVKGERIRGKTIDEQANSKTRTLNEEAKWGRF